eukprot:819960-Alexandrium_andersonii.AAC.1
MDPHLGAIPPPQSYVPPSEPPPNLQDSPFRRQIRNKREQLRRPHPLDASGIDFEAVPGPG